MYSGNLALLRDTNEGGVGERGPSLGKSGTDVKASLDLLSSPLFFFCKMLFSFHSVFPFQCFCCLLAHYQFVSQFIQAVLYFATNVGMF